MTDVAEHLCGHLVRCFTALRGPFLAPCGRAAGHDGKHVPAEQCR